ncbi:MAG: replicative DNA helicase [Candidatus Sedimenticola sp. (ex Thyasira tokunagai)]
MSVSEQAVLGSVLIAPDKFVDIVDQLSASDFQGEEHKRIWHAFVDLDKAGESIDPVLMASSMPDPTYIHKLYHNTSTAANLQSYVARVKSDSQERRLRVVLSDGMEIAKGEGNVQEKIDKVSSLIMGVAERSVVAGPTPIKESLSGWMAMLEERNNNPGELLGVSTGLRELDEITAGLQRTDLIIVAGRPSMGKTTLAMNFAEQVAVRDRKRALVFSLEMSSEQLITRSVCSLSAVNQSKVKQADLNNDEWKKVADGTALLANSGLIVDETPALTILDLRTRARREHRKAPLDLIVVDYIQLMAGKGDNQNLIVSEISRGLKALAKELNVPVVALSQLNRGIEQRTDKRPRMADLRDSGAIEQDADLIIFVYRDELHNTDTPNKGVAEIILSKQRNGETGKVFAEFQGQYCRFKNFSGQIHEESHSKKYVGGFGG